jgi:hypothetical protein
MIETDTEKADWQAGSQNKSTSEEITFPQTSSNTLEKVASQGLEPNDNVVKSRKISF